jgi:hypothetical protein
MRWVQLMDVHFHYWPACGWTVGVRAGIRVLARR